MRGSKLEVDGSMTNQELIVETGSWVRGHHYTIFSTVTHLQFAIKIVNT